MVDENSTPFDGQRPCHQCGANLMRDQRYCRECGAAQAEPLEQTARFSPPIIGPYAQPTHQPTPPTFTLPPSAKDGLANVLGRARTVAKQAQTKAAPIVAEVRTDPKGTLHGVSGVIDRAGRAGASAIETSAQSGSINQAVTVIRGGKRAPKELRYAIVACAVLAFLGSVGPWFHFSADVLEDSLISGYTARGGFPGFLTFPLLAIPILAGWRLGAIDERARWLALLIAPAFGLHLVVVLLEMAWLIVARVTIGFFDAFGTQSDTRWGVTALLLGDLIGIGLGIAMWFWLATHRSRPTVVTPYSG